MNRLQITTCLLALATPGLAQEFTDRFDTNTTSAPSGWTARSGNWRVVGNRLQTDGGRTWSYITKDGFQPLNSVIDLEAFYTSSGVQFAGITSRYASDNATLMCKIQENTTSTLDFDRSFIYERGATGNTYADLTTKVSGSAIIRFIVAGNQCWMEHDFDKDGVFDQTIGPRTITNQLAAGFIGANIYGISQIDNWEYHNAVLKPQTGASPRIGTTFKMDLLTTATKITPWRMALSGGNKGFPFGARRIPLDADPIFDLSLALSPVLGLAGITDSAGVAAPGLVIPNMTPLVGLTLFAAAITMDSARPLGVDNISNEIAIKIVQ